MLRILLSTAAAAVFSVATMTAQTTPDFTGTWAMDVTRSQSAVLGPASAREQPVLLIIRQTPEGLQIERQLDGKTSSVTYSFSQEAPVETALQTDPKAVGTSGNSASAPVLGVVGTEVKDARAEWDNGRLIATTTMNINGMTTRAGELLTLANGGRELLVDTVVQVQHGYEGQKSAGKGRDVYVRVAR